MQAPSGGACLQIANQKDSGPHQPIEPEKNNEFLEAYKNRGEINICYLHNVIYKSIGLDTAASSFNCGVLHFGLNPTLP